MIIDAHSHYMPPAVAAKTTFFKAGWSDVEHQLDVMDDAEIEKALLIYPTSDAHIQLGGWQTLCNMYNPDIARVVRAYPGRFIGAGILPVDNPQNMLIELLRIQELGLKAISLASSYDGVYLNDERFYPVYEFARRNKMPIHVHPQIMNPIGEDRVKDPLLTPVLEYVFDVSICIGKMMMGGTFMKFDDVQFIFAHYGGVLPLVKERFDTTYQMLRKRELVKDIFMHPSEYFKSLYFDTSGSKSVASLLCALEVVDANHLLFGSDFPANQKFDKSIAAITTAPINEEARRNILQNTLLKSL